MNLYISRNVEMERKMLKALMISVVLVNGGGVERNPYFDDKVFDTLAECQMLQRQYGFTQNEPYGYRGVRFICLMVKEV